MQISHIFSINTVFVKEAHLDKWPLCEAHNHFMPPCSSNSMFTYHPNNPCYPYLILSSCTQCLSTQAGYLCLFIPTHYAHSATTQSFIVFIVIIIQNLALYKISSWTFKKSEPYILQHNHRVL